MVTVDRSNSGHVDSHEAFQPIMKTELQKKARHELYLHIFVDWSGIKVFNEAGTPPISVRVFPPEDADQISISGQNCVVELDVYLLKSTIKKNNNCLRAV